MPTKNNATKKTLPLPGHSISPTIRYQYTPELGFYLSLSPTLAKYTRVTFSLSLSLSPTLKIHQGHSLSLFFKNYI